jgi:hypothetical protein
MAKNQHVIPRDGKWVVQGAGNVRATRIAASRREALRVARDIARRQGTDVVVHERDGGVEIDSYGNDPVPLQNGSH